jgi:coenzyme Q-binding protein COQ10
MTKRVERLHTKFTVEQLFDLVADVDRYPEFLPWVLSAHTRMRDDGKLQAVMTMGAGFLRKQFTTVAVLERPHRIDVSSRDPMFERFEQTWLFEPTEGGADVIYRVDFEFKSGMLQTLVGGSFSDRAPAMMEAFSQRARRLYGTHRGRSARA